ncbi:hypothetical protein [Aeromonas intestinalis]
MKATHAYGVPSDIQYAPPSKHSVPAKDLPVYGRPDQEQLDQLAAELNSLHARGEVVMKQKRTRSPKSPSFPMGHKIGRRFGFDDTALACALSHLGLTTYAICSLLEARTGKRPAHQTVTAMVSGKSYEDLRKSPGHANRVTHYVSFFDPALRASPSWTVSTRALEEAKASKPGDFYRGGR